MDIDFCRIEGGSFSMGSDPAGVAGQRAMFAYAFREAPRAETEAWLLKHTPSTPVTLPPFEMSRTLVSRRQFATFERALWNGRSRLTEGDGELPIEGVSFFQARHFCQWLSAQTGASVSLPSEAQWEYAASSRGRHRFPWGNEFDPSKANVAESGIGHATKVEAFASGMSEQGILDLAGNLEEWTDTLYLPYPGGAFVHDDISRENGGSYAVLRGGCYRHHGDLCLAFRRHGYRKNYTPVGFRVVRRPAPASSSSPAS